VVRDDASLVARKAIGRLSAVNCYLQSIFICFLGREIATKPGIEEAAVPEDVSSVVNLVILLGTAEMEGAVVVVAVAVAATAIGIIHMVAVEVVGAAGTRKQFKFVKSHKKITYLKLLQISFQISFSLTQEEAHKIQVSFSLAQEKTLQVQVQVQVSFRETVLFQVSQESFSQSLS